MTYHRPMPCAVDTDPYYVSPARQAALDAQEAEDRSDAMADLDGALADAWTDARVHLSRKEFAAALRAKVEAIEGGKP